MRYYIIAGEASGDLHAANLAKAVLRQAPQTELRGWGGDLMSAAGVRIMKHYRELAFMGFVEVLFNLRTILRNITACKADILAYQPDAIILIDYPGFNMRIAKWAKANGIKTIYYISPQIWAWRESRVHQIKATVDNMICILPFEPDFYKKYNYEVQYLGHPLLDVIPPDDFATSRPQPQKTTVALLPGSRKQEISKMLELMLSVVPQFPEIDFVVAGAPSIEADFYQQILAKYTNVSYISNQTYDLLRKSDAALVTSGTATLEVALFGVPEVVCYKGNAISFWLAKRLIKVKYISLVNLIMDKEVVRELIQTELTTDNLVKELRRLLNKQHAAHLQNEYQILREKLGNAGASERVAQSVLMK